MKLMVIDGNSIVNRAFYGIRLLTNSEGTPTNAVYGFLNILNKLLADESPDALCVAFDLKGPTFRHERYDGYKATRKPMPEELAVQMPLLKEVLDAMCIPRYELSGWEADDLIGTISRKCAAAGWECVAVTGDKDSFQLISGTTRVRHVKTRMGRTETTDYTVEEFEKEYGFPPEGIIDLKALMGDASDNIPGVSGIGEKTAMALVQQFGSVEALYDNLGDPSIRDSVRRKLEEGREQAALSRELATIRCDAPIEFKPEENLRREPDNDALYGVFRRLDFEKLIERYGLTPPREGEPEQVFEGTCASLEVTDRASLEEMLRALRAADCVSVAADDGLAVVTAVCDAPDSTAYILRDGATEDFAGALAALFAEDIKKAGHHIKDTQRKLLERGIRSGGWISDTALAAYLLSPTDSSYELPVLTKKYANYTLGGSQDDNEQTSLFDTPDEAPALIREAAAIRLLRETLETQLRELGMWELYVTAELPLCPVLAEMERTGVYVDRQALQDFSGILKEGIDRLEAEIYDLCGGEFNISSPKQLGEVLFEKLLLPAPKKTKTGYSTNIDVLEKLLPRHPVIAKIIEYRKLTKLRSTYTDGLQKEIADDGRIHTCFQMTVTATGRLSSTEPNLQNIPVRTPLGGEIRKMFTAEEGKVLVDADYSQIELRLLAHISGDETMRSAFLSGEDIHAVTASQVFGVPLEEVTGVQRSRAKAVNFGIVYGISAFSLSQDIGVSVAEAKRYMDSYLEKYAGIRRYMAEIVERARTDGYVTTQFGRRRYLPELRSSNRNVRQFGERVALNAPIQGTAADIMKLAMVHAAERIEREGLASRIILQVHDELIAECPEEEADQVARILTEEMEHAADLTVPLTVEAHTGKSWFDAK
ncbi:MAG: DNA polymerase I [Oscillospiraceae bacterium]|nr:DNA polymerase I [Oscillospiraceae bacterium]